MREGKGMVRVIVIALLLGIGGSSLAPGKDASAHTGYWRNTGNALNVRAGPGGSYEVIGTIDSWGVIKAYGHRSNWIKGKVLATGQVGWMWRWNFHASSYTPAAPAPAPSGIQLCWDTTFNWTACAPEWIAQTIVAAADAYGVPRWAMLQLAACESAFDPSAQIAEVYGLYQFRLDTMAWVYPGGNVWSVSDSSYAAAKLLTIDPWQFDCSWRIGYV